jgi:hypothetical protein
VSIYVPVFPPLTVPAALGDPGTWHRFDALRDRVERDGPQLAAIRAVLAPLEAELWDEADELGCDGDGAQDEERATFVETAWTRVDRALERISS